MRQITIKFKYDKWWDRDYCRVETAEEGMHMKLNWLVLTAAINKELKL